MDRDLTAKYLKHLRERHGLTQEGLADDLSISRQAVSKWETGGGLPDLDTLLSLSKLYGVTINEILEPAVKLPYLAGFEELPQVEPARLAAVLLGLPKEDIVTAAMGASPEINAFLEAFLSSVDFAGERARIGRVRLAAVEGAQTRIVSLINLN